MSSPSLHGSQSSGDLLILIMHALHRVSPGLAPFHLNPLGIQNHDGSPFRSQADVWVCPKWHGPALSLTILAFFRGGMFWTTNGWQGSFISLTIIRIHFLHRVAPSTAPLQTGTSDCVACGRSLCTSCEHPQQNGWMLLTATEEEGST